MLLCCLRRALRPSTTGLNLSKLYQHFRERDFPYGLQDSLCTLTLYFRSSVTQLLNKINTRYGWLVRPYPTGTFTLQDTLSFAQRDNVQLSRISCDGGLCATIASLRAAHKLTAREMSAGAACYVQSLKFQYNSQFLPLTPRYYCFNSFASATTYRGKAHNIT